MDTVGSTTELDALERLNIFHRLIMGKLCLQASSFIFDLTFVKLAGNQDRHKISDEFEFRPDRISYFGVASPGERIKYSIELLWNLQDHLANLDQIYYIVSGLGERLLLGF